MKKKLVASVLALTLAVTSVVAGPAVSVNAAEPIPYAPAAKLDDSGLYTASAYLHDGNNCHELVVGDTVYCTVESFSDPSDNEIPLDDWNVSTDEEVTKGGYALNIFTDADEYADKGDNYISFDDVIPEEAFGKYVYHTVDIYLKSNPTDVKSFSFRSDSTIKAWDKTYSYTFNSNGDGKTVSVYTIWNNHKKKNLSIASSVTIAGKKYKVNTIGNYAASEIGAATLKSVTIPASVTTIGNFAFSEATTLKTITIKGNLKKVGKKAFSNVDKNATFKIKANEKNFKKIVSLLKKGGAPKKATFKRI